MLCWYTYFGVNMVKRTDTIPAFVVYYLDQRRVFKTRGQKFLSYLDQIMQEQKTPIVINVEKINFDEYERAEE